MKSAAWVHCGSVNLATAAVAIVAVAVEIVAVVTAAVEQIWSAEIVRRVKSVTKGAIENPVAGNESVSRVIRVPKPARSVPARHENSGVDVGLSFLLGTQAASAVKVVPFLL